jgi:hypothetical protein
VYFMKNTDSLPEGSVCTSDGYNYSVEVDYVPKWSNEILILNIQEWFNGTVTNGGSNFQITLQGPNELDMCYYDDHLNGNYTVECPLFRGCNHVTVKLDYVNFNAYRDVNNLPPFVNIIYKTVVCVKQYEILDDNKTSCRKRELFKDDVMNMIWRNTTGKWRLYRLGCETEAGLGDVSCMCDSTHPVTAIGASHMRYYYDWIMKECDMLEPGLNRKHGSLRKNHFSYIQNRFVKTMFEQLVMNTQSGNAKDSSHVMMFQFGAHDLCFYGQLNFVVDVYKFIGNISKLFQHRSQGKTRNVFFATVPYPDKTTNPQYRGYRNSYIALAANYLMKTKLREIEPNIDMFDIHRLLFPRHNVVACTDHYVCRLNNGNVVGEAGEEIMQYFFGKICSS